MRKRIGFLKKFWRTLVLLQATGTPWFGLLMTSALGFKARLRASSPACFKCLVFHEHTSGPTFVRCKQLRMYSLVKTVFVHYTTEGLARHRLVDGLRRFGAFTSMSSDIINNTSQMDIDIFTRANKSRTSRFIHDRLYYSLWQFIELLQLPHPLPLNGKYSAVCHMWTNVKQPSTFVLMNVNISHSKTSLKVKIRWLVKTLTVK